MNSPTDLAKVQCIRTCSNVSAFSVGSTDCRHAHMQMLLQERRAEWRMCTCYLCKLQHQRCMHAHWLALTVTAPQHSCALAASQMRCWPAVISHQRQHFSCCCKCADMSAQWTLIPSLAVYASMNPPKVYPALLAVNTRLPKEKLLYLLL